MSRIERVAVRDLRAAIGAAAEHAAAPEFTGAVETYLTRQLIDDRRGVTVAAASSLDETIRGQTKSGADKAAATEVGKLIAERAKAAGVSEVVFDRGGYLYHGRVKALAEAAREGGLTF